VVVDHAHHVGPRLIGAAVDRALGVEVLALGVDRLAVEIELDDVVALDALGRARARQEEAVRLSGWRMLMWPNESTMPYLASTWFAVTRSSSKSSSFAMSVFLPDELCCQDASRVGAASVVSTLRQLGWCRKAMTCRGRPPGSIRAAIYCAVRG
jgi:hypothetical protein